MECEADRLDACSEERAETKGKALNLLDQTSPELWVVTKNKENREYNRGNKFPSVGWLGSEVWSLDIRKE